MSIIHHHSVYARNGVDRYVEMYATETHIGLVVKVDSQVKQMMSDVWDNYYWAVVAMDEAGTNFTTVDLGYGDFLSKSWNVDASPELKAKYKEHLRQEKIHQDAADRARYEHDRKIAEEKRRKEQARIAALPQKGQSVKVVIDGRTRNPAVIVRDGKVGEVFWTKYGIPGENERLGVRFSDSKDARGFYNDVAWLTVKQVQKVA